MKEKLQDLIKRLSNVGTIIALASAVLFILNSAGVLVDNGTIMDIITGVCSIGVILGFLNNPQSSGVYLPFVKDNLPDPNNKPQEEEKKNEE